MKRRAGAKIKAVLVMGSFLLAAGGCVSTQSSREYAAYRAEVDNWSFPKKVFVAVKDFALDWSDVISVEAGAGEGFLGHVQVTKLLEGGAGYVDAMKFLCDRRAVGFAREKRKEGGLGPVYYRSLMFEPIHGTPSLGQRPRSMEDFTIRHNEAGHWADVGVDGHLLFMGLGVRVSPKELVDALGSTVMLPFNLCARPVLGLFRIYPPEVDFSEDDTAAEVRRRYQLILVEQHPGLGPAETVNEWVQVPY